MATIFRLFLESNLNKTNGPLIYDKWSKLDQDKWLYK